MIIKEIYPFDTEWYDMVHDIMDNGGVFWITQRTDTNQFYVQELDFDIFLDDKHGNPTKWVDEMPILTKGEPVLISAASFYPTKELADKFAPKEIKEGGCSCCGNGSVEVPIQIIKHEHINK